MKFNRIFILFGSLVIIAIFFVVFLINRERIDIKVLNKTKGDINNIFWTCNGDLRGDKFEVLSQKEVVKRIYPRCEGEFGITMNIENMVINKRLIDYIPLGLPAIVGVEVISLSDIKIIVKKE